MDKFEERIQQCIDPKRKNPDQVLFRLLFEGQRDLSKQLRDHETRISHIEGKITVLLAMSGATLTLILFLFKLLFG